MICVQEEAAVQPGAEGFRPYIASKGNTTDTKVTKDVPTTEVRWRPT